MGCAGAGPRGLTGDILLFGIFEEGDGWGGHGESSSDCGCGGGLSPAPRLLAVAFDDGAAGIVHLGEVLDACDGVFAPLLTSDFFARVRVDRELGTVVWPNGADIAPETLYEAARRQR